VPVRWFSPPGDNVDLDDNVDDDDHDDDVDDGDDDSCNGEDDGEDEMKEAICFFPYLIESYKSIQSEVREYCNYNTSFSQKFHEIDAVQEC
jgi:hypothetical protein